MATKRGVSVGVEITGSAKGYKSAANDAKKATDELKKNAQRNAKEAEQSFKQVSMSIAKVGAALLVVKEALGVFVKILKSTEIGNDRFREATDYATGAVFGLNRSISLGKWDQLITNIKTAAAAAREMGVAMDALEDYIVGDSITLGQFERKLQAARLEYAEFMDIDPGRAKSALQEAIYYQKQITALEVQQLKERSKIDENYYSKLSDQSESYFDYLITQLPLIAQNQRMLLDPVYIQGLEKQIEGLEYLKRLGGAAFNESKKAELHIAKMALYTIEDFKMLRDEMSKPGQFNAYIEGLGKVQAKIAAGDQELVRLVKQLATLDKKYKESVIINQPSTGFTIPSFGNMPDLAGIQKGNIKTTVDETTDSLSKQASMVATLQNTFEQMFINVGGGFKGMIKAMMDSIKLLLAQLVAKAAVFGILKLLFPEVFIAKDLYKVGSFKKFLGLADGGIVTKPTLAMIGEGKEPEAVIPLSKLNSFGTQKIKVEIDGKLLGSNIYFSAVRYAEILNDNT